MNRLAPSEIAPDTFVIHNWIGGGSEPVVHVNLMVVRGAEPVVVDTGARLHRDTVLADLFAVVDPDDVRWIFLSHEDIDHSGNVNVLLERCRNATLVATRYLCERLLDELDHRPERWRWVGHEERLDIGDRSLVAIRPPLYDSPTTRGLLDPTTGVYWASDCFAAPVSAPTAFADETDPFAWEDGFVTFHAEDAPWAALLDPRAFGREVARLETDEIRTVASCHGPTVRGRHLDRAFDLLRTVPTAPVPPQPGQSLLDGLVTASGRPPRPPLPPSCHPGTGAGTEEKP